MSFLLAVCPLFARMEHVGSPWTDVREIDIYCAKICPQKIQMTLKSAKITCVLYMNTDVHF
jgi:hypothetical protein